MDDRKARFEAQVLPHLDAAFRFARWLVPVPGEVDDVVQEAFLRAFRAFDGWRGGDVKSWLFAIVRNCHADQLRRRLRSDAVPLVEEPQAAPEADPEGATVAIEDAATLERAIGRLAAEHREVLLLREIEELPYREIATVTGVPIGTVMSRLARARAALRAAWLAENPEVPRAVR